MKQPFFKIDSRIEVISQRATRLVNESFKAIDEVVEHNQVKVLSAFINSGVSETHFNPTTGYGYGDRGRDVLDQVFAYAFGAEDALVRHGITSGTHALTIALFAILRPGDSMVCLTGKPYDTLEEVIGIRGESQGSLKDFGIKYQQVELDENLRPNLFEIKAAVDKHTKVAYIQRSRGYSVRPSLSCADIEKIIKAVKAVNQDAIIVVDNCYGEFVERDEPIIAGADLLVGSLIKNPGGGIAPSGGYIAGRKDLVSLCANRYSSPGTGKEIGANLGINRSLYMGIFNAPHVTGEALKTAVFASAFFELLGYKVYPAYSDPRYDIIQTIVLKDPEVMKAFCQGIQKGSPIDSFVCPEPWDMPGYDNQIIMAAGTFISGASIELSADGPLRDPYAAWMQGGLNFHSAKMGIMIAAQEMLSQNKIVIK